jgi:hypothetical protein
MKPTTTTLKDMRHQGSMFCWLAVMLNTYEKGLVENQFYRQMGVFSTDCNGHAVLADGTLTMKADDGRQEESIDVGSMECQKGAGGSWDNTEVYKKLWHIIIGDGRYKLSDWLIKVDVDAVFRPAAFRFLAKNMGLNADERIYFKNFMDGYPIVGAIEVASRPVFEAMEGNPGECDGLYMPAEDDWFLNCVRHHGAREVYDEKLLQHENHPEGSRCSDGLFVALHPYKDVDSMNGCEEAGWHD